MRRTKLVCLLLVTLSATGCKSDSSRKQEAPPPATSDDLARLEALRASAEHALDALEALETQKDVTCWTSFRQLDWFIAEKSYSELATLAKVSAIKELTRAAWAKASKVAEAGTIGAEHVTRAVALPAVAVPESVQDQLSSFANDIGLKNYTDYQKTAEHWRVVLAVLQDEMVQTGGHPQLLPLDPGGLEELANVATTLSLMLLKESGAAAEAKKSTVVEGEHVHAAYLQIAKSHGLESAPRQRLALSTELVEKYVQPLTKRLIDGKARALQRFNAARLAQEKGASAALKESNQKVTADINRVARIPVTPEALAIWRLQLQSFIHFVSKGYVPMRADNYLDDGSYAPTKMRRLAYVDETQTQNIVMQVFPHRMLPNGDVIVRYEPNPGPVTGLVLEPIEIRVLDHEMNGVRDSAIHWISTGVAWDEKPFAMDPFAAEYLTEVVSMMLAAWMRRAELIAKEQGKQQIDAAVAKKVRTRSYVMVQPPDPARIKWGEEQKRAKEALLSAYRGPLFRDISRKAGLPTKLERFGSSLEDVQGHVAPELKDVKGHVEPDKDLKKVTGHVEPDKDLKKVTGHVEPDKDLKKVTGHVEPDTKSVQGHFDLQTIMGGGIAVGDVNGDTYPDLYLTGEALGRLYLNRGKAAPGTFVDATKAWGLPEDIDDGHGTLFFDIEGDGDQDLLVLRSRRSSMLFVQEGGKFVEAGTRLGLETQRGAHVAHVFDYDRDGDLDIYIGYYGAQAANAAPGKVRSVPSLDGRNGSPNQLWRNDGGKLTEVGVAAGVADVGWTLAVGSFDADGDGDLDLYLANDFGANAMLENRGDGTFADITERTGTGDRGSGMNVDVADLNADGRWDIYVTNIDMFSKNIKVVFPRDETTIDINESLTRAFQYLSGNKLYVSSPEGYRAEEETRFEPRDHGWGWDAAFFDYENDGDDDIYITNGWINGSYAGNQKNQMYLNDKGVFYLAPESSPEAFAGNTRSAAVLDIDLDGDLDVIANQFRQPPRVFENVQRTRNRWVQLRLKGVGKNPAAIGATLTIRGGDRSVLRQVSGGRGYLSQASTLITAGVASAKSVDVAIVWPDGSRSEIKGLATNQMHVVEQAVARPR